MTGLSDGMPHLPARNVPAGDGEEMPVWASEVGSNNQDWLASWHPPGMPPEGTPHGSGALCVVRTGEVVLISEDGEHWDIPAGRPEADETWLETLRREVHEEACATIISARLLGFCRSACTAGPEQGRIIVRSMWRAEVELDPWAPQFEIVHRRLVAPSAVLDQVSMADTLARLLSRALREAALTE